MTAISPKHFVVKAVRKLHLRVGNGHCSVLLSVAEVVATAY